jgi:hypothetical protein
MLYRRQVIALLIFLCVIPAGLSAQIVTGRIVNEQNEPVPYATLFIQELKEGTITNAEGNFRIQVPRGNYHFVIRSLGYLQIEKDIQVDSDSLRLDLVMQRQEFEIKEVLVFPGKEDPAYFIVRKAMARAAYYREKIKHYEADLYIKSNFRFTNIPRLYQNKMEIDGRKLKDVLKENMTYVIESHNKITFDYPQQYKQEVISKRSSLVGFDEPPVMGLITSSFYETRPNGVISPLSPLALKHYNFRYEGFITSGNHDVFKIKVEPKRKSDELVSGYMYIVDQLWCLYSVDFKTQIKFFSYAIKQQYENLGNANWLPVSHLIEGDFSMLGLKGEFFYGASLKYGTIEENFFAEAFDMPKDSVIPEIRESGAKETALRKEVAEITDKEELTNRDVRKVGRLNRKILKEQYQDTTIIPVRHGSYKMEDKADSIITDREYWDTVRTIPLSPAEIRSYQVTDSLRTHSKKSGDEEKKGPAKQKSLVKKIVAGHHDFCPDSLIRLGYDGLIAPGNYDFNVVDGYKYKQKLRFRANPDSGKFIYVVPELGYAFHRKALFWQVENQFRNVFWTNSRLNIDFGKVSRDFKPAGLGISPILNSASSWFFAKNYMKLYETSFVKLNASQRVARNLNILPALEYNHFRPLENHAVYKLSDKKEYEPNIPLGLEAGSHALMQQKSFVYGMSAVYRKTQRKPWLEKSGFLFISDFYNFQIGYRQGIKNVFSSESDFSHLNFRFNQQANISPVAGIDWKLNAGTFFHANQMHFSQYKHFATAEIPVSFSSFSHTFQLLKDYRPSTSQSYLNVGAELRSEFLLLRYLSVINQRTWSESIHFNYLTTPAMKNYLETGYSINSLFFIGNAGVFAGFNESRFESLMLKISVSGL